MNHPHATLQNILTFMWCIWKSRNDCLFGRKKGHPYQIHLNARALQNNLELHNLIESDLQVQQQVQAPSQHTLESASIPHQGCTLRSDLLISGARVYADASWKCNKTPAAAGSTVTGIGVFLQYETNGQSFKVMIQASTTLLPSVLQAEAKALLLAAKLAEWLQIDKPTFLTDNQVLAKAAASRTIDHALLHWEARNILADFFNATHRSGAQVFHIRRDLNFVAHNCAHQVLRQDLSQPIYSCVRSAHANSPCPAISVLQNLVCQDFVIHAVLCN
jgi:ribonuclease HI